MNGQHFLEVVNAWTDDDLQLTYDYRLSHMLYGNGNIISPAAFKVAPYLPFELSDYVWRHKLGNINGRDWIRLMRMKPETLLCGNPFAASLTRKNGYRVWDAAVAIPACHLRGTRPKRYDEIPAMRRCNKYWLDVALPALQRVGPIGFDRAVLRPTGPNIFDLTRMDLGWKILEAAHVLAHLRGDFKPPHRDYATDTTTINGHFRSYMAEIVFALKYDLPLDTSARNNNDPGEPDFQYGIEIKSSSTFLDPVLKLPLNNRESAQPDRTLAVVEIGIHIEPHPHGFANKTGNVGPNDHWCCMPTIAVIAGWECVDVIMHQALGQDHFKDKPNEKAPAVYVMRPADLMEPDLLWGYLASAYQTLGPPVVNERWRYFHEWIASDDYAKALAKTPPLICPGCMSFIKNSDSAPQHPKWDHDPKMQKKDEVEENKRVEGRKKAHAIVQAAIEKHERREVYPDARAMNDARKQRKTAHRAKLAENAEARAFVKVLYKLRNCGQVEYGHKFPIGALTPNQWQTYYDFIRNHGKAEADEIEAHARQMGWLTLK